MLEKLKQHKAFKSKTAQGVEAVVAADHSFAFNLSGLKKKKSQLSVSLQKEGLSLDELKREVQKNSPVLLSLTGKGIIHKKMEKSEDDSPAQYLSAVLPNADMKEFYLQVAEAEGEMVFVSVIRKDLLNKLTESIIPHCPFILEIFLGPFPVNTSAKVFGLSDSIPLADCKVEFSGRKISDVIPHEKPQNNPDKINLDEDRIPLNLLLAFSLALHYFVPCSHLVTYGNPLPERSKEDFFQRQLFVKAGIASLGIFLVLLLGNFMLFSHYNNKFDGLSSQSLQHKSLINQLDTLKGKVEQKQAFISESSFTRAGRISFYADQVAKGVPGEIRLTSLGINSPEKKIKEDEKIIFNDKQVLVEGVTSQSTILDRWIESLEKLKWVVKVNIMDYHLDEEQKGVFQLKITY